MRVADRYEGALQALDQAETIAGRLGSPLELSKIHYYRGNIYFPLGNIEGCISEQQKALAYARDAGAAECEARALSGLGDASYSRGRMATALRYFRDCIELCRQNGFGRIEAGNRYMVAWTQLYQNEIQQALDEALQACEAASLIGHHRAEIIARLTAGRVLYEIGKPSEAKTQLEKGMELARTIGATRFEPLSMIYLGRIRRDQDGGGAGARQMMIGALEMSRRTGLSFLGPWVLSTLALVCDDRQDRAEALREGEELLNGDCVGHNHLAFYRDAIEVSLQERDWDNVDRYTSRLEDYTRPEPLPWTDFFIARGRILASIGRGDDDEETRAKLAELADQARAIGLATALPALDEVLNEFKSRS
jgi:tetratricopeptide (TPR) repeat protein